MQPVFKNDIPIKEEAITSSGMLSAALSVCDAIDSS